MDRGNRDAHRRTYSGGIKAIEAEKWGRQTARERYGPLKQVDTRPPDRSEPQRLGDSNNLRGSMNDHRNDWVRGYGKGGVESAETKPNFDHSKGRRK